jgi:hypothetical protein
MFLRYLGGGIGHLEQFPPAHSNDEGAAVHNSDINEVETDNFSLDEDSMDHSSDSEGEEDYETEEDDKGYDTEEDEVEGEGGADNIGSALDEETGNVY